MTLDDDDCRRILREVIRDIKARHDEATTMFNTSSGEDKALYQRECAAYHGVYRNLEKHITKAIKQKHDRLADEKASKVDGFGIF